MIMHLRSKKFGVKMIEYDEADHELISKYHWHIQSGRKSNHTCYPVCHIYLTDGRRTIIGMHRIIMGDRKGFVIDHINRNGLDNRRINLRHTSYFVNRINSQASSRSKLGVKNIRLVCGKYSVQIQRKSRLVFSRSFSSIDEAIRVRDYETERIDKLND